MVRWGLVPSWAKDPSGGARMINARSESAASKPAFRRALKPRRCLLPADGWYEWQRGPASTSSRTSCTTATAARIALAGLWEYWKPKDDPEGEYPDGLVTACVLTTDAVGPLAQVHDRMPLVLPPSAWAAWLDPDRAPDDEAVAALLAPPSPELVARLELRPVSPAGEQRAQQRSRAARRPAARGGRRAAAARPAGGPEPAVTRTPVADRRDRHRATAAA